MVTQHRLWIISVGIALILVTMACTLSPAAPTPTTTPGLPAVVKGGGTGGSTGGNTGGNTGGSNAGNSGNNGGNSGGTGDTGGSNVEPVPTRLPDTNQYPYAVKQIETLGGESISGIVCSLTRPFTVLSATPHVTFSFVFTPQSAGAGGVSYSYSIPSAGESHDASGSYTIVPAGTDGTLELSLSVSDHVVFKGFDGNIPNRYKFDLVPAPGTTCPPPP